MSSFSASVWGRHTGTQLETRIERSMDRSTIRHVVVVLQDINDVLPLRQGDGAGGTVALDMDTDQEGSGTQVMSWKRLPSSDLTQAMEDLSFATMVMLSTNTGMIMQVLSLRQIQMLWSD